MNFISNGDYNFPFDVHYYWMKLVYIWSYQTGSANPDGIIRAPGRIIDLLFFNLFGNIPISVFYLLTCFAIVFVAFYLFSKYFLKIANVWLSIIASLFFTINPIFLGNASKIGLVLAAAMLPLCLVVIQKVFEKQQLRYLLLWVACLNISLIHPFTFTVNIVISGIYLVYMARRNRLYVRKNIPKIALIGLTGLLLNAYFLLPLASLGTVSKDVLSANVTTTPTNYASLIDVANTGDIFTGIALAKGVLKDYEFYNDNTQALYFLGIFTFYVILFGVYVRVEKKLSISDRRYFALALAAFLGLLLLAAVNYLFVKDLIKLVVGLPGGWIFRSPLKWQLYVPFAMATMLAIALVYITKKPHKIFLFSGLTISFICMNGFIATDIYSKLLTPRSINYFSVLQNTNLDHKNLLIINDERCFPFASEHSNVMTELNQILTSKNIQVKQVGLDVADTVNLSAYDYVLGCQSSSDTLLQPYDFGSATQLVDNAFQLYANKSPKEYVYSNQNVFSIEKPQQTGGKYAMITKTLGLPFDFIDATDQADETTYGVQDVYENMTFGDLAKGSVGATVKLLQSSKKQTLYVKDAPNVNYELSQNQLNLSPEQQQNYQALGDTVDIPKTDMLNVTYKDVNYDSANIFPNASLEDGPWQKEVGDCYAYGESGKISMKAIENDKTAGAKALQLEAETHVACTGPDDISVQSGQNYLLSFDYKTLTGRYGAYYVSFDDEAGTSFFQRLDDTSGDWQTITKNITVPPGARTLKLLLYAYPDTSGINTGLARYDNFQMTAVPDLQDHFYVLSSPTETLQPPKKISFEVVNPTKTIIRVQSATTPFYLETKESFSPKWSLAVENGATIPDEKHLRVNNFMNGWLVDPGAVCSNSCTKNDDGTYDITMVMEFAPQHWLTIGTGISSLTVLSIVGYFIYDNRRGRQTRYARMSK